MSLSYNLKDGEDAMELIEYLTLNASQVQQQVLEEILTRNANTEYLSGFLGGQNDKELFKEKVPFVNYEDIKPYTERIANGEPSQLISAQPIAEFYLSSGTSGGQPKMIPTTEEDMARKTLFSNLRAALMNQYIDGLDQGKVMYLFFVKKEIRTPSGLMARAALTSIYKSNNFKSRSYNKSIINTSPYETIVCSDNMQSMYCQLLCCLIQRDEVLRVGAVFASTFLRAVKFLEDYWRELCSNIRIGCLSDWITDQGCRNAVTGILKMPDLIEFECSLRSWEGIIKSLWCRTKYIEVIITGSMAHYIPTLDFYSGGLPLVSTSYGSSECFIGINLEPLCKPSDVSYTAIPNMAYFELLLLGKNHEEVVDLVDLKVGCYYEIVVTTFTGLYRFRMGDILMVTGFHNKAPQFQFIHRRDVVLSINMEKTSEDDLLKAVTQAKILLEPLDFLLTDYSSYADTSSIPGHYVLFWEMKMRGSCNPVWLNTTVMEDCCNVVEESLDQVYKGCRTRGRSIGPLEIRVVKQGAFDELMDYSVSKGSSLSQYKTPRCIKSKEALEILNSSVVERFFSSKAPL